MFPCINNNQYNDEFGTYVYRYHADVKNNSQSSNNTIYKYPKYPLYNNTAYRPHSTDSRRTHIMGNNNL